MLRSTHSPSPTSGSSAAPASSSSDATMIGGGAAAAAGSIGASSGCFGLMLRSTHSPSPTSGSSAAPASSSSDATIVGGGAAAPAPAGSGGAPSGAKLLQILNVRVVGNGDSVVVLSHGFGSDQSAWSRVLPYLTRDHRVVLYDLIFAGSVNPEHFDFRRYDTLDSYVDDLLAILDALRIPRCAFVGHSFSTMIGILASVRRPELFAKLVLICPSPRFMNDHEYNGGFELPEIQQVYDAMAANYSAWVVGYAQQAVGADVPSAVQEYSRTLLNMRPDISLHVCRTVFNTDTRGMLGMVRSPCVVVLTTSDLSVMASVPAYLKHHLGALTTLEFLHTEGHLPHVSAPGLLAQVLRRALARY